MKYRNICKEESADKKNWIPCVSVKIKLIVSMMAILGATIITCIMMNRTFLPAFYEYNKVSALSDTFEQVNHIVKKDKTFSGKYKSLSENSRLKLDILSANNVSSVYVFELSQFFDTLMYSFDYPNDGAINDIQREEVKNKTYEYIMNMNGEDGYRTLKGKELIKRSKSYGVYKAYDRKIGSYYLELFGALDSGSFVFIRTNYQSMKESVNVSNQFLTYLGLGATLAGCILMLFIGNSFTKPILQISDIARRMSELDFDVKYPVQTQDEIGVLGNSINILSERLEEKIKELKVANNELQNDIQNKIQIDEMRKEFLSNVSHELKTPIALIQGYAEGLQENINDDAESREFYCDVIIDEAKKMNKMVKKLLTLNQIEFGENQVSFERFDIVQVIRSVIHSASILAEQKGAKIIFDETEKEDVWADEYFVEEVITNYISNAINHVDGIKEIRVKLEKKDKVVRISVFNTGKCIPEEELDKIWIKFYKVDKARTREYGGSGIGLSIVKAIMDSMNQECGVINHADGVEFWFELDRNHD